MALLEINKCSDIDCKYISREFYCPDDWFDEEMFAECKHPDAPTSNFLGDDNRDDYLDIPEWCPLRRDK